LNEQFAEEARPAQRLDALLSPRSIAVIGASPRPDTPGHDTLRQLARIGYAGKIIPVNPKYRRPALRSQSGGPRRGTGPCRHRG